MPAPEVTSPLVPTLLQDLRRHLLWQEEEGLRHFPAPAPLKPNAVQISKVEPVQAERSRSPTEGALRRAQGERGVPSTPPNSIALKPAPEPRRPLDEVRQELGDCRRCKLCEGRKQIVFGAGSPHAQLVFVGEGPGADEDLQGLPFVGAAGQLLTKMIAAMGFTRDEVYICNVVKCRPPGNRNPEPEEIAACEPFLKAQLASLAPKVIVALGKFAAQTLLRDETPISRLRGQWREYEGVRLMPTFHPAYLLRSPEEKRVAWTDLQQVMAFLGKEVRKG